MTTFLLLLAMMVVFALAGLLALLTARAVPVFVTLLRSRPEIADQALQRGDSVSAWWDPSRAPRRSGPQNQYRRARAGRFRPGRGVVAVQEHASNHKIG